MDNEAKLFVDMVKQGRLSKAKKIADRASKNKEILCAALAENYAEMGNNIKAKEYFVKSISVKPSWPALNGLGVILLNEGDLNRAIECYKRCMSIQGLESKSLQKMAAIYRLGGDYKESVSCYEILLNDLGEDNVTINTNMGVLLADMGEYEKSYPFYEKAFEQDPATSEFNYSIHLLAKGDFKKGLKHYESRVWFKKPPGVEWNGEHGQNVLVVPEQGYGDVIQFARFLPDLKKVSNKVTLLCSKELFEIMKNLEGPDDVVEFNNGDSFIELEKSRDKDVSFGKFVRMMSIPHKLDMDVKDVPNEKYLRANPEKVQYWAERMGGGFKVGLCWQGGARKAIECRSMDKRRSMKLSDLTPVLDVEDVEFFSLQKDNSTPHPKIKDFMGECKSFMDTAAIMENLNLIITVDTSVAHLAGALAKPVWIFSRKGGCWRWLNEGDDTFWYPSAKMFRQSETWGWENEALLASENLKKLLADRV